jgi:hypothetical protein
MCDLIGQDLFDRPGLDLGTDGRSSLSSKALLAHNTGDEGCAVFVGVSHHHFLAF